MIIVNSFQPLTIITKSSNLDVEAVLEPPLRTLRKLYLVTFGIFSLQSLLLRQGDFKTDFDFDNFDFFGIKYFDSYQKLLFKYVLTKKSLRRKDTSNFGEIFRIRLSGLCISCSFCLLSTSS